MKFHSNETKLSKYYVEDPNLKVRFKIINGIRYWITLPPVNYEK